MCSLGLRDLITHSGRRATDKTFARLLAIAEDHLLQRSADDFSLPVVLRETYGDFCPVLHFYIL